MKRFACLSFILLASCGDDGGTPIDAAAIDAAAIDARIIDAAVDAAPTTFSGTLTALEVAILNPTGAPTPFFGQGLQVGISFGDSVTGVTPTMEEQPGSPLGCKLFEYNRAQAIQSSVGNNEGDVTVTVGATALPVCKHTANVGYTCPHTGTASTGGIIARGAPLPAGTASLNDVDVTFNAGNTTNRYVSITGATNPANNGTFPIVMLAGANTIVYANPAAVAETIPATGSHVNLAGIGPTPGAADPGFLLDADAVSFAVAPGGGNHFTAFTAMTANVGDDFVMPAAEQNKLNAIPNTGAAFTITCDGGTCGAASGTLLVLQTTDSPVAGLSPFTLPLPTTKRTMVRCAGIGATSITVPAPYMAALMASGWTRIQATFMRPALMSGGPANVNAIGGHAIVGFTNRPAN